MNKTTEEVNASFDGKVSKHCMIICIQKSGTYAEWSIMCYDQQKDLDHPG